MTREAEARSYEAFWTEWEASHPSYQSPAAHPSFHAGFGAGVAAERERTAALVAAGTFWLSHGGHAHWCGDPCDCGTTALRAALRAYEEGVSE